MKKYLWIIILVHVLAVPALAQNDTAKLRPKQKIEYRHNISAQLNPAGNCLALMISNQTFETNYVMWHGALRYTYAVHPNILVGGEASYTSFEYYDANSQKDKTKFSFGSWSHDLGAMARFVYNKPQWCRPFADIVIGYRRVYSARRPTQEEVDFSMRQMYVQNKFQWYAAVGVSFRFWENHFSIDLMCKASTLSFADLRRVTFGWKIGYNFNSQNKKK